MSRRLLDVRPQLEAVRARVAALAPARGPAVEDFIGGVRDVVVIASSSRGGSSVFSETLRASPDLMHLQAELNPLLTLARLHPEQELVLRLNANPVTGYAWRIDQTIDQTILLPDGSKFTQTSQQRSRGEQVGTQLLHWQRLTTSWTARSI